MLNETYLILFGLILCVILIALVWSQEKAYNDIHEILKVGGAHDSEKKTVSIDNTDDLGVRGYNKSLDMVRNSNSSEFNMMRPNFPPERLF